MLHTSDNSYRQNVQSFTSFFIPQTSILEGIVPSGVRERAFRTRKEHSRETLGLFFVIRTIHSQQRHNASEHAAQSRRAVPYRDVFRPTLVQASTLLIYLIPYCCHTDACRIKLRHKTGASLNKAPQRYDEHFLRPHRSLKNCVNYNIETAMGLPPRLPPWSPLQQNHPLLMGKTPPRT